MKILFLDIDGVIRPYDKEGTELKPSLEKLLILQRIVKETDCKIVLSSDWRRNKELKLKIARALRQLGILLYDSTPVLNTSVYGSYRQEEIVDWLHTNNCENCRYAILDDLDSAMILDDPDSFFKCNYSIGLTEEIATKVIEYLNDAR